MIEISEDMIAIFEIMSEGILMIDHHANIIYGNKAYCNFLKTELSEIKGKRLRDIRPGARLPNVLTEKKPILQAPRQEIEDIYFVNMYPVFKDNEIIGGISIITFVQQAEGFQKILKQVQYKNKQVIKCISKANNAKYTFDDIIAVSPSSNNAKELALRAALTDATVLLQSESGAGKELYAQAIHNAGPRSEEVFLSVNCANFKASMLESELFGYVKGAFTGANPNGKIGLFEAASGGTIFLDEISEMELPLQATLLRVLQEQTIRPLGAVEEREVDVRVIAACNVDLQQYMREGKFRADLFYRLNVFPICVPPLRERREDIELLILSFLEQLSRKCKRNICMEAKAIAHLTAYHWPGNVRELRNIIEYTSYLTDDGIIRESMLPDSIKVSNKDVCLTLQQRVKNYERNEILRLLNVNGDDTNGKRKTAEQLGISLASLYNKLGY